MNNNLSSDHLDLLASSIDVVLEKLFQLLSFYSLKRKILIFRELRFIFFVKIMFFFNRPMSLLAYNITHCFSPKALAVLFHFSLWRQRRKILQNHLPTLKSLLQEVILLPFSLMSTRKDRKLLLFFQALQLKYRLIHALSCYDKKPKWLNQDMHFICIQSLSSWQFLKLYLLFKPTKELKNQTNEIITQWTKITTFTQSLFSLRPLSLWSSLIYVASGE